MLQEVLESGGGGGDTKDAMSLRTADSLNPVLLMPTLWRALLIRDVMFSVSFGLSLNPRLWGSLKVRSSIAATMAEGDFFLLALVFGFRWTTFQPSGAGEAATEAKDLGGPLDGGGRGLGGPSSAGAAGGFAVGLCLEAERSGAFGEDGGGGGGRRWRQWGSLLLPG